MSAVILFDLDGTLVDSRDDLTTAGNAARAACGLPPLTRDAVASMVGDGMQVLLERLCPEVEESVFATARAAFIETYDAVCCEQTRTYPGIEAAIIELYRREAVMAVVSNKPTRWSERIVAAQGLDECLPVVVGGDRGAKKPDPGPLRLALEALGAQAEGTWMVGDHDNDIRAGRAAGCRTAWCEWGLARCSVEPERRIQDPHRLGEVLLG